MRLATRITVCLFAFSVTLSADSENDWRRVERFPRGQVVAVTTAAGARIRGQLLRADADSILLYSPAIGTVKLKPIEQLIRRDARRLEDVDRVPLLVEDGDVRIAADGVSRKGVRVAEFNDLFSVIPRADVVFVVQPKEQRESYGATIAGVLIGGGAGFLGALRIALSDHPCQPQCLVRPAGVFLGGATLGGIAGNRLGKPHSDLVIYRR